MDDFPFATKSNSSCFFGLKSSPSNPDFGSIICRHFEPHSNSSKTQHICFVGVAQELGCPIQHELRHICKGGFRSKQTRWMRSKGMSDIFQCHPVDSSMNPTHLTRRICDKRYNMEVWPYFILLSTVSEFIVYRTGCFAMSSQHKKFTSSTRIQEWSKRSKPMKWFQCCEFLMHFAMSAISICLIDTLLSQILSRLGMPRSFDFLASSSMVIQKFREIHSTRIEKQPRCRVLGWGGRI